MNKADILEQLAPFTDEVKVVLRDGSQIIDFQSMKYGFHNNEGTLFIDIYDCDQPPQ